MFRKKTLTISERDPIYKVRYLGNVLTGFVKGDGCVDKPTQILWNNYLATSNNSNNASGGLDMELTVCNAGLKVLTKEQGLTEYRSHRIMYSIHPDKHPKLFVWVYKHEGRKLKSEVRCHAVLCKTDVIAQSISGQLHERLCNALDEYMREKKRRQNARIIVRRTNSVPSDAGCPGGSAIRTKFLNTGQNFKPSIDRSTSAPKLGSITEGDEELERLTECPEERMLGHHRGTWSTFPEIDEEELEEETFMYNGGSNGAPNGSNLLSMRTRYSTGTSDVITTVANGLSAVSLSSASKTSNGDVTMPDEMVVEMRPGVNGKAERSSCGGLDGDCDTDSIESGFSEQDASPLEAL